MPADDRQVVHGTGGGEGQTVFSGVLENGFTCECEGAYLAMRVDETNLALATSYGYLTNCYPNQPLPEKLLVFVPVHRNHVAGLLRIWRGVRLEVKPLHGFEFALSPAPDITS